MISRWKRRLRVLALALLCGAGAFYGLLWCLRGVVVCVREEKTVYRFETAVDANVGCGFFARSLQFDEVWSRAFPLLVDRKGSPSLSMGVMVDAPVGSPVEAFRIASVALRDRDGATRVLRFWSGWCPLTTNTPKQVAGRLDQLEEMTFDDMQPPIQLTAELFVLRHGKDEVFRCSGELGRETTRTTHWYTLLDQ